MIRGVDSAVDYAVGVIRRQYRHESYDRVVLPIAKRIVEYVQAYLDNPTGDTHPLRHLSEDLSQLLGNSGEKDEHLKTIASLIEIDDNFSVDF